MVTLPIFIYSNECKIDIHVPSFAMRAMGYSKWHTSWLVTTSGDILMLRVPYLTMMNSTAVRSVHEV